MSDTEQARRIEDAIVHLASKTELANVETKLANVELRLIKWIIGTGIAALLVVSAQLWGAVQLLLRLHA
jgi:hypothetical protein